jgi:hypothetical protein
MDILRVKSLIRKPEENRPQGKDKGDGIPEDRRGNGCQFFKTFFRIPVERFASLDIYFYGRFQHRSFPYFFTRIQDTHGNIIIP